MTAKRALELLRNPLYVARRLALLIRQIRHPDEPWLGRNAIQFCETHLTPAMRGVEWGSGRSTAFLARRVGHLTSVEHDQEWHRKVSREVADLSNVDYRFVALDHKANEPTTPHYEPLPRYVAVIEAFPDASLDFVLVDGHYRQACILASLRKLKKGGYLIVDNTDWLPESEWGVPPTYRVVHRSANVMSETTFWEKR